MEPPPREGNGYLPVPEDETKHVHRPTVVVINENTLVRDCLSRCLELLDKQTDIWACATAEEWERSGKSGSGCVVLLYISGRRATEVAIRQDVAKLKASGLGDIIIISDDAQLSLIAEALENGVKGYITADLSLDVAIHAIHLVRAGGIFVPATVLLASRLPQAADAQSQAHSPPFTLRQSAVIEAIRKGKPNKIIAYELQMGECTVKVHVRNIMRKLKARNRTEVAYLTNSLFEDGNG